MNGKQIVENWMEELTQHQRDLISMGLCPFCGQRVKDYKPVFGYFAPEIWATQRENGVDPSTGHKKDCKHKAIKL